MYKYIITPLLREKAEILLKALGSPALCLTNMLTGERNALRKKRQEFVNLSINNQ